MLCLVTSIMGMTWITTNIHMLMMVHSPEQHQQQAHTPQQAQVATGQVGQPQQAHTSSLVARIRRKQKKLVYRHPRIR
jgi:hypothetical protein